MGSRRLELFGLLVFLGGCATYRYNAQPAGTELSVNAIGPGVSHRMFAGSVDAAVRSGQLVFAETRDGFISVGGYGAAGLSYSDYPVSSYERMSYMGWQMTGGVAADAAHEAAQDANINALAAAHAPNGGK